MPRWRQIPAEERFWEKVDKIGSCWIYTAGKTAAGYGQFSIGKTKIYAHRYAYELLVGPIPTGLSIDHLCRTRACVNPDHMEPVTRGENVLRGNGIAGIASRRNECSRGHKYTPKTLYVTSTGKRQCRKCKNERRKRAREEKQQSQTKGSAK